MALRLDEEVLFKYGLIKEVKIVLERLKEWKCKKCDYTAVLKKNLDRHEEAAHAVVHRTMLQTIARLRMQIGKKFSCDKCSFKAEKKSA